METLLALGDGSLIKGIVILPFAFNGLLLVIKGAFAYLEEIDQKHTFKKNWHISLFFLLIILSYTAFVYAITRLL